VKILVVEDDSDVVSMMELALSSDLPDAEATMVDEAHEAVGIAEREQPDFIVLDSGVAGLSTEDLVMRLSAVAPNSRVVLYSAVDRATLEQKSKMLGVPAFPKGSLRGLIEYIRSTR
jgi:DNA-binding response OmpR family regulator